MGLQVTARMSLLDTRYVKYEHAVIGTIITTLNTGSVVLTFFPNFNLSLNDPYLSTALKVQIPGFQASSDALFIMADSGQIPTIVQAPKQLEKEDLQKLIPTEWVTNYEKLQASQSKPVQATDPLFINQRDGTIKTIFTKTGESSSAPSIFQASMIQPVSRPREKIPIHSFQSSRNTSSGMCPRDEPPRMHFVFSFQVYAPSVKVKTKLKNGTYSIKSKPIYPGCVFLWCVLNKELHDFVREECAGVGGFIGSKVGNNKRQINRPRPVSVEDMEEIFREAKEEQEKYDREFEEEQQKEGVPNSLKLADDDVTKLVTDSKSTRGFQKVSDSPANDSPRKKTSKLPTAGSTVRVVSGTFAEFVGTLKKLNRKTGKATVGFTLFGKETLIELDRREIVAENE
eukprot:XP_002527883.2 uncharacterized protein LOC8273460 [Ricinus communis]